MSIAHRAMLFRRSVGAQQGMFRSYGAGLTNQAEAINISPLRGEAGGIGMDELITRHPKLSSTL
jgi:hypothetical protein